MRLFVALEIPSAIRDSFDALINGLRTLDSKPTAKKPRWVRSGNLHVTLKFIGETLPEKLDAIGGALAEVRFAGPLELRFCGLGFFPDARRPRVVWGGIEASPSLASVAGDIDQRLARLGFPGEPRAYRPHLTLARCEASAISAALRAAIEDNSARDFGLLRANEFHLVESKLKPTGAEYTTLKSFSFTQT